MKKSAYSLFCRLRRPSRCLYNIAHIENVPSIMRYGILSYNRARNFEHQSIALNDVQDLRERVIVPNGLKLHDYANVYFNPRNPMMYRRQNMAHELCILAVSAEILDLPSCVVTDGNAASGATRFYPPYEGIMHLDFERIFAEWWTDDDPWKQQNNKRVECAEVLVPHVITPKMIYGAVVVESTAKNRLIEIGFDNEVVIRPRMFFR